MLAYGNASRMLITNLIRSPARRLTDCWNASRTGHLHLAACVDSSTITEQWIRTSSLNLHDLPAGNSLSSRTSTAWEPHAGCCPCAPRARGSSTSHARSVEHDGELSIIGLRAQTGSRPDSGKLDPGDTSRFMSSLLANRLPPSHNRG